MTPAELTDSHHEMRWIKFSYSVLVVNFLTIFLGLSAQDAFAGSLGVGAGALGGQYSLTNANSTGIIPYRGAGGFAELRWSVNGGAKGVRTNSLIFEPFAYYGIFVATDMMNTRAGGGLDLVSGNLFWGIMGEQTRISVQSGDTAASSRMVDYGMRGGFCVLLEGVTLRLGAEATAGNANVRIRGVTAARTVAHIGFFFSIYLPVITGRGESK